MNESLEFLKEYCDFSDPNYVWMLKGIARNKDNTDPLAERFMRRLVLRVEDDIEFCYNELHKLANDSNTIYRIYISLNSRDVSKGLFNFQKKLLEIGYGLSRGLNDHLHMSKRLDSIWKTELEQRSCRGTKRFLLDLDNETDGDVADGIVEYLDQTMKVPIHCCSQTVSGWAIVFDACDTRELLNLCKHEWELEVDLQRDSMVFVEQFRGGE